MKERLDVLLVNNGLAESREKAKRTIMAGLVTVNGRVEDKPGSTFDTDSDIEVKGKECPYVSRGGLKLEKAIEDADKVMEQRRNGIFKTDAAYAYERVTEGTPQDNSNII